VLHKYHKLKLSPAIFAIFVIIVIILAHQHKATGVKIKLLLLLCTNMIVKCHGILIRRTRLESSIMIQKMSKAEQSCEFADVILTRRFKPLSLFTLIHKKPEAS